MLLENIFKVFTFLWIISFIVSIFPDVGIEEHYRLFFINLTILLISSIVILSITIYRVFFVLIPTI